MGIKSAKTNMFYNARIKLTAWYLLIIMLVSISFSVLLYRVLTQEFERFERLQRFRIERRFNQDIPPPPQFGQRFILPVDPELIREAKNRIILMLLLINTGVFFISGGLGFVLAGRTLAPIKEMVEEQNRFISDASHELRTPLTSLKTALEVNLRDKDLTLSQAKKLISENIDDVNKLQSLSDQLLKLAQFEKPKSNLHFDKINLKKVIEKSVGRMTSLSKQKKITYKTTLQNVNVYGHEDSLIDLFVILLDNAIKYSETSGEVKIKVTLDTKFATVTLSDQGIGIGDKDIPHIFDRFYRADSARQKKDANGYGLGLSIAKKIINQHKGTIKAKSQLGKGTEMIIQLPRHLA